MILTRIGRMTKTGSKMRLPSFPCQQRKKLPLQFFAFRDHGNTFEQRLVGIRYNAVADHVYYDGTPRPGRRIRERSVQRHRMMETGLTGFQNDRNRLECGSLIIVQNTEHGVHIVRQVRPRQQVPPVASGHVVNTSVFFTRVVQADPASQMSDRFRSRPVGIVLMPGDHAAVVSGLYKKLVVPKPHRPTEKLTSGHRNRSIEKQVVKSR